MGGGKTINFGFYSPGLYPMGNKLAKTVKMSNICEMKRYLYNFIQKRYIFVLINKYIPINIYNLKKNETNIKIKCFFIQINL